MDETNASSIISSTTTKSPASNSSCSSSKTTAEHSIISGVANNMETKGTNIPSNAHHHEGTTSRQSSNNPSLIVSREATNGATTTATASDSSQLKHGEASNEDVVDSAAACASRKSTVTCEPDIANVSCEETRQNHHSAALNISTDIDPLKESTNSTLASHQLLQTEESSSSTAPTTTTSISVSTSKSTTDAVLKGKVAAISGETEKSNSSKELSQEAVNDSSSNNNKGAVVVSSSSTGVSKPPVPNFRVEGSGAGDSSITVAVASLSSAVSASVSRGSTGGSNSLENGEQPGSSSGPVSIQSSEEMRLSLVSWYSEPEEIPSRLIEGCCSALNTYRTDANGILIDEIVDHTNNSSMGHEAISSVTNSSPVCKSESEEKENKTPEPCGNIDKMNGDRDECTNGTFTNSEFITPTKKTDCGSSSGNNLVCDGSKDESRNVNQSLANKTNDSCAQNCAAKTTSHSARDHSKARTGAPLQKAKGNVHLVEQNKTCGTTGGHSSRCQLDNANRSSKPECPRCSRRSKSGTTTPASGPPIARASRRVVQSSKSSTEIKKPIKSILKHDSRGSASGSGSDKQSSMDSLGSSGDIGMTPVHNFRGRVPNTLMTRSDSGARARFNFNTGATRPGDTPTSIPQDKVVSKLKRIEKYATLRVRKNIKPRPLDYNEGQSNDMTTSSSSSSGKVGIPGAPTDMMSKSMSYLEKSSNRVHISSAQGQACGESLSASSTLKRQGSLRAKKNSTPQWEPSGTRTSALRLQKMQQAKAKTDGGRGGGGGGASSGSANSGSGDSLHYMSHSANSSGVSASGGTSGISSIHLSGSHSASSAHHHARMTASAAAKEKHMGAKIFSKLSSALGQTASSNQKRVKQERGVQTEMLASNVVSSGIDPLTAGRISVSPVPTLDLENVEQIKNLERLCNRYRNQYMRIQTDYEKSESRKVELQKQLEETQHESTEMIEFLQAEKSTLAESLTEVEVEAKKWKDEMDAIRKDYESRCSSLVRLSEQHKQEALKSQALLHRLESQSTTVISQLSHQITDGAQSVHQTRQRITALTDSLMKTYKVPPELLASSETSQKIKETDLSCSLLLPLIASLSAAFPMIPLDAIKPHSSSTALATGPVSSILDAEGGKTSATKWTTDSSNKLTNPSTSTIATECSSLQSLNQAILEREAAEKSGLDDIMKPFSLYDGVSPDTDQVSLKKEIAELNIAIAKLLCLVRVIVIHCDRKVSSVASSILQCLKSIEDDKGGNIAEIAQVQKSLEAWSEKGMSSSGAPSATRDNDGGQPCKTTATTATSDTSSYLVGNGHAHM